MSKAKKPANLGEGNEATAVNPSSEVTEVTVVDRNGEVIRTYSKALQGENFRQLAETFVSKVEGRRII